MACGPGSLDDISQKGASIDVPFLWAAIPGLHPAGRRWRGVKNCSWQFFVTNALRPDGHASKYPQ
jgi:hypothetical protein